MANPPKKRSITDVLGVDFGTTSTKLIRLRKSGSGYTLVDADVQDRFDFTAPSGKQKLALSKKLGSLYAAACYSSERANVRLLDIPSKLSDPRLMQSRVRKALGLDAEQREGFCIARPGADGVDHKVLAVGIPEREIQALRSLFASHRPSLISLEIAGLAALNSFSHTETVKNATGAVCYMESGAYSTVISFFLNGELRLARKLSYGSAFIQKRVEEMLNIGEDEALGVLFEDATALVNSALDPIGGMLQEISISQKFVERNDNCKVESIYASGGLSYSPYWAHVVQKTLGVPMQVWNPFLENGITHYPKGVKGVESMFAPAIGAALTVLQAS